MARLATALLGLLVLAPLLARAEDAPPCRRGTKEEVKLVDVAVATAPDLSARDHGTLKVQVTNRTLLVVCRVLGEVSLDGRDRPARCVGTGTLGPGALGVMACTFPLSAADRPPPPLSPAAPDGRHARRAAAPKTPRAPTTKLVITEIDFADARAYAAWRARRAAPASQSASGPIISRGGFRHTLTVVRASDPKEARRQLDRAVVRLRECLLTRARRNPKLKVQATLRLGVSRARGEDAEADSMLAVKVLDPKAAGSDVRDCAGALDLFVVPARLDFEARAEIHYDADGQPPPELPEAEATPVGPQSPSTPHRDPNAGRPMSPRRGGF
jgi:hypothetical protein